MEKTTACGLPYDRDRDVRGMNMEAGFMSSAISEQNSSSHGFAMPSWTVIPILYHAPPDYDVTGISVASCDEASVKNRKCRMQDSYGVPWKIDADKLDEHKEATQGVAKHASDGLSAMKSLRYSEAVSCFDAALKKLWPCHLKTLLRVWIEVHRGHALLRAGLLQCPAGHGQDTSDLLEASMKTFWDCQDILRTEKLNPSHPFNKSLLFGSVLGLAWIYFFQGKTTPGLSLTVNDWILDASLIKLQRSHLRADRDIDTIFLQVALQRVTGNLQDTKKCLRSFGPNLSKYVEDIFLVQLLDREWSALTGALNVSVLHTVHCALHPEEKFGAYPREPFVAKFLEQLEAGYSGNLWLALGVWKQAKVAYETALASESLILQAAALVGLGNVLMSDRVVKQESFASGNTETNNSFDIQTDQSKLPFANAEKMYKRALQIYDKLGYKVAQITVHCNLGNLYHKREQLELALSQYKKAETYFSGLMSTSSGALHLHLKFAELHLDLEKWDEAFKSIQESARIPTTFNQQGKALVHHLYGTYYLKKALAMKDKSKQSNTAAHSSQTYFSRWSVATRSKDEQSSDLSKAKRHLRIAAKHFAEIQLSLGRGTTSLWSTIFEQQKKTYALLLWCIACQRDNGTSATEALVWCERARSRSLMVERWERFSSPLREHLSDEVDVFEALFATASEKFDNLKWEENWENLQTLLARCTLSTKTVIVEYVLCADFGYLIFVMDMPRGQPKMKRISFDEQKLNGEKLTRARLTALVNSTNQMVCKLGSKPGESEEVETMLTSLYKLLIEPVEKWLRKSEHVILIPHEVLFTVPFHALIDGNKGYLIERYTLSCAESIRNLVQCWFLWEPRLRSQQRQDHYNTSIANEREWVVVGINKHKHVVDLKSAEEEAKEIASLVHGSSVKVEIFRGSEATKEQVIAHLAHAEVIHLATHGIINAKYERGGILFAAPANLDFGEGATSIVSDEPAYGASESAEVTRRSLDDFRKSVKWWEASKNCAKKLVLSASEISNMDLKAQLVVLSACQSADGVILGEGVAGLGRALLTAGVPCTVLSLWPVSDKSAPDFMKKFYTEFVGGRSVADAMRTAMVTMISAIRSKQRKYTVRHWAAFQSFGLSVVRIQDPVPRREPPQLSPPRRRLMWPFRFWWRKPISQPEEAYGDKDEENDFLPLTLTLKIFVVYTLPLIILSASVLAFHFIL